MFENQGKRFITKGIDMKVPKEIQVVCWQFVDALVMKKGTKVDYLQIFEF